MADEAKLKCPRCGSDDLVSRGLGIRGLGWQVTFGQGFDKDDIMAHACKQCRFVFLALAGELVERTPAARRAGRLFSRFRRH